MSKIWSLLDYAGELAALHSVNSKFPNCSVAFRLFSFSITVFGYTRSRLNDFVFLVTCLHVKVAIMDMSRHFVMLRLVDISFLAILTYLQNELCFWVIRGLYSDRKRCLLQALGMVHLSWTLYMSVLMSAKG